MDEITIIDQVPEMLFGKELTYNLSLLPEKKIVNGKKEQLLALSDIYKVFIPSTMSCEIYNKIYLALIHSLKKKELSVMTQQQKINYQTMLHYPSDRGIIGGADSFSIIGTPGIGKSSSIERVIELITEENKIYVNKHPYMKIIPFLCIQCPFDSSVKGMLLEILRKVDEYLGSNYYDKSISKKTSIDLLIGCVSQIAMNNIGILIIDEIQNVSNSKNGRNLIGCLTQLINNSGISICFVGTPEVDKFFQSAMYMARRTIGLRYKTLEYNSDYFNLCNILFQYQYTDTSIEPTEDIINWLYNHSNGNVSTVITLFHDAQEIAIMSGESNISIEVLNNAYANRMGTMHSHINVDIQEQKPKKRKKQSLPKQLTDIKTMDCDENMISNLVTYAKENNVNIVDTLKEQISVTRIEVKK